MDKSTDSYLDVAKACYLSFASEILNRVGADENETGPVASSGLISKIDVNDKNRYESCGKKKFRCIGP
jgi:hypothetical protein